MSDLRPARVYLRLSITDACNLRCRYCRPATGGAPPQGPAASDDELVELVRTVDAEVGLSKLRFTGGEPLMYAGLLPLVRRLRAALPNVRLALTTNGTLLAGLADELRAAGITAINVSLDSVAADRFRQWTGGAVEDALQGIAATVAAGFEQLKINTVLIRRCNGDALPELVRFAATHGGEIRFIELMPCGQGAALFESDFMPADEALGAILDAFAYLGPEPATGTAQRHRFLVGDHEVVVGMITPVSHPFCSRCDRLRLDRRGRLTACLRCEGHVGLLPALRDGGAEAVRGLVRETLGAKRLPGDHWPRRAMVAIGG
jgi:cyclic pyranopterin phosphate synthase